MSKKDNVEKIIDLKADVKLRVNGELVDFQSVVDALTCKEGQSVKRDIKGKPMVVREYEYTIDLKNKLTNMLDAIESSYKQNKISVKGDDAKHHVASSFMGINSWMERMISELKDEIAIAEKVVVAKREAYQQSNFYVAI